MAYLLVVHHSPTDKLRAITDTVILAAEGAAAEVNTSLPTGRHLEIRERDALEPDTGELLGASALLFGTTANFGYISGALKHYFDSTYMQVTGDSGYAARTVPASYWIRGGYDTTGAEKAMTAITTGYGWDMAVEPVCFTGDPAPHSAELRALAEDTVGAWYAAVA
ncbi:flavodoxin family protein [uncultured Corynebacterium sp.]|uniref:flavodoxin family protein n=1 Tax=uncultured Corynebacterium sp. TaxID=159447 RepID=UPI0025F1F75F|nr:flavodoxin family protein [uncultured Corynebacterium sp.]